MTHILIIDDSPEQIQYLKGLLTSNGYAVSAAKTGEEGLAMAKKLKPDLILMDVVMPGLNGFQATRKLAKAPDTSNIPVIIVSSKGEETDKIWGMRQGAKGYLDKKEVAQQGSILLDTISKVLYS